MARGWESKSVEAQQDEAASRSTSQKPRLTKEGADRARAKENLRLSLRNILQQLDRNPPPGHRSMLEKARTDLEDKINALASDR